MSRNSRKNKPGEYFHVMCQGINKEYIFNDDFLKKQYKKLLKSKLTDNNIKILAYCIMDNHVHLIINTENIEKMSNYMKQVNTSYAMKYNKLKSRVGYVFRDRFLSKTIKTELQLQRCLVYIHRNPVVAKIVKKEEEYKYSSYNEYLRKIDEESLIHSKSRNIVFGTDNIESILENYYKIHHIKDEELKEFDSFKENEKIITNTLLNKYKELDDNETIIRLNTYDGISEREIAKAFNISRYHIRKILKGSTKRGRSFFG